MKKTFFPEEFINKYKEFCGDEWDEFFKSIQTKQPKSAWINTKKVGTDQIYKKLEEKDIFFKKYSFSKQAFEINMKKPAELEEFKKGKISLQEKGAMLPVVALGISEDDIVLDACSAPGMKTIQAATFAKKVTSCDVNSERIKSLLHNKSKYGLNNVEIKRTDVRNIKEKFDKIILDAPCSSEGLVRKKRDALKGWSQKLVERKSEIQKELILHCFDLLKEGGEMVYATCSFAPEENEEVVNYLIKKRNTAKTVKINLEGIKIRENKSCVNCVRLWPQDNDTQQFFFVKIKKN
jgi:NOL1/NOP2/sun family putative RNA methylase